MQLNNALFKWEIETDASEFRAVVIAGAFEYHS